MATMPGQQVIDRRTGAVIGTTGTVPGAIYQNGRIIGYVGADYIVKPQSTTLPYSGTSTQPGSTPFISRTSVSGTEDVRNLPYGTTTQNRTATSPNQTVGANTQISSPANATFDVKAYVDSQFQAYMDAQKPKAPSTPEEIQKWIYDHYGYMAAYINHPEIGHILQEAARNEVTSEAQLFGMLSATEWWKTTSLVARQWDYLVNTDPAEAKRQRDERSSHITNLAGTLGIGMEGDLESFADRAMRAGWSDDQITDYLVARVRGQDVFTEGQLGALQNKIRETAAQYLIDVSDQTSAAYARRIASGELTVEGAASVFAQQARARFPWMAENIDKGITPADYFFPMRDQIAKGLEVSPDDIDPMDPKWLEMMEMTDATSGERRGATQYELQRRIRGNGGFYKTNGAQKLYTDLAFGIGQHLGAF